VLVSKKGGGLIAKSVTKTVFKKESGKWIGGAT
jgi:hypothetical protein